jgi:TetR/AcrR family transcriptional regulator, fatty acid metabolism regulator protein
MIKNRKEPTLRALNAIETKNKLLQAALKLFTKHGFDKVTVEDITNHSGVSKGTFYNHFSTKEQVIVEQFDSIDAYYVKTLASLDPAASASERTLLFIDAMCKFCSEVWGLSFLKIVYMNQISIGERPSILLKKGRLFYSIIETIVKQGRESGEFRTDMPFNDQVYLFASTARSLLYEWCLHDGGFDLREGGRQFFGRVLCFLRQPSGQRRNKRRASA